VLFAHPGDLTVATALTGTTSFVSIMLSLKVMEEAAAELGQCRTPSWRAAQIRDPALFTHIMRWQGTLTEVKTVQHADAAVRELVALMFARCIERRTSEPATAQRASVKRVCDYLQENYQQRFGMCALAKSVGISRHHLSRTFSEEFGVTPLAYAMHVRLAKAKALLSSDLPVQQIAVETGFADQSHFTRNFRDAYGVTPVQYLRAIRTT
jgi:AraC-like DNA-binding protein